MNRSIFYLFSLSASMGLMAQEKTPYVQGDYQAFLEEAIQEKDWWAVVDYAAILREHFPENPRQPELSFLEAEGYYEMGYLVQANESYNRYLEENLAPKHFAQVMERKFEIAERFRKGERKNFFNSHKMPKISSGKDEALSMYEDITAVMPHHEMSALSCMGKAEIFGEKGEFKLAHEALDLLLRRFSNTSFAAKAYLEKGRLYLEEAKGTSFDPAIEELVEINLKRFEAAFPRESSLSMAKAYQKEILEQFARHLFETGFFFEKTKRKEAANLYYQQVVSKYPFTEVAQIAQSKLD